jgi:hypothetical protein
MKRLTTLILLLLASIVYGAPKRQVGVFAQPVVDKNGVKLLQKWYDAGTRVFIGWASVKNTSGSTRPRTVRRNSNGELR